MPKSHKLMDYTVGLFENHITACGVPGTLEDHGLVHYITGAVFWISDNPTCKSCIAAGEQKHDQE